MYSKARTGFWDNIAQEHAKCAHSEMVSHYRGRKTYNISEGDGAARIH